MQEVRGSQSQAGGVVGFIIIGVVLAALTVGGIAAMKWRGNQAASGEAQTAQTETNGGETTPAPSDETDDAGDQPVSSDQTQTTTQAPSTAATTAQPAVSGEAIAATGPAETLAATVALGALTAGIGYAYRSRTARARL